MGDEVILRDGAEALVPEEQAKEIIQGAIAQSATLSLFRRLPNMASNKLRMPVLDLLPVSYFVNGDTGMKQATRMAWKNKYINIEEIAVIVPIAEAVLDDARDNGYDIWGEVIPRVQESFGKVIDGATLFDVNKPSSWRNGIVTSAIEAGNVKTNSGNFFDDVYGEDGVIAKVEESGFNPSGVISSIRLKGKLRGLKDNNGRPLYLQDLHNGVTTYAIDGMNTNFLVNGAYDESKASMIVGDFNEAVYSIRQDLTVKLLTEGVIQDPQTKEILYNLAQQDMVALRFVMRLGWEVPNPINALNPDEETRFPFAVYTSASSSNSSDDTDLTKKTVAELKAIAEELEIEVPTNATKAEIIALIEAKQSE